ncbi:MAG: serine/threonine-protein kinase [Myxococcota bacterium]
MTGITGQEDTIIGGGLDTVPGDASTERAGRAQSLQSGERVGRYVVLSELGAGGMGVVLAAYDPELDRKVAVKLVRPEARSTTARERMVREARAMAKLAHPNVVSVFDAGEHDGAVYIAMEFVEGMTLAEALGGPRGPNAVLDLLVPAARGLVAAHEIGLVHRDFKPDNVMVGADGRLLVMDFGLARREGDPGPSDAAEEVSQVADVRASAVLGDSMDSEITRAGAVMGTPAYMAPEQFNSGAVDERADQFAFCVTLWEALYGERPFAGEAFWALAAAVNAGQRQPVPRDRKVPGWLHAVVDRGLATDPAERWPSMSALLQAIEQGRARRRNRWVAAGIAAPLVLGAAGFGGHRAWIERGVAQCEEEARAQMPWPARAVALEAGMLGTGKPFAAASHGTIEEQLDAWSESWVELRAEACVDERIHHQRGPTLNEAQRLCLATSNRSTALVLEELEQGHPEVLIVAVDQVSWTTNLDPCRDWAALSRKTRAEPEVAELAERANDTLSEMTMLQFSGQYDEALALGREALGVVESTGFDAGIAGAKTRVGSLLSIMGRQQESRTMLEEAYFLAGAAAEDDIAANAARFLVGVGPGAEPHGIGWVRGWASHATMLHERLGMEQSLEQAEVLEALAVALAYDDQPETVSEEIELLKRAREIRVKASSAEHPAVLVADLNLASYEAERDPTMSLEPFLELRGRLQEVLGPGHPVMVTLLIMLGSIEAERGLFDEAQGHLDQAVSAAVETFGPEHPTTVQAREARDEVVAMAQAAG